jgi:drug/metabolite transporter (DMT)-like permease
MDVVQSGSIGEANNASRKSGEALGILAAILSSSVGGINTAATRYVIGATDPVTLAGMRFGLGFLLLLPIALMVGSRWPKGRDWFGVALLGILFFAIFMGLLNLSLRYTSAARGALALSTLPLVTMLVASAWRADPPTRRKSVGVLSAIGSVAAALITGLDDAPLGAWRGDAIMLAAVLCFAFYNVWSRPFIARSSPLGFVTAGMGAGSLAVSTLALAGGGFASAGDLPHSAVVHTCRECGFALVERDARAAGRMGWLRLSCLLQKGDSLHCVRVSGE